MVRLVGCLVNHAHDFFWARGRDGWFEVPVAALAGAEVLGGTRAAAPDRGDVLWQLWD